MAAGVELHADAVEPFRRALAAHAGAALSPTDLLRSEHVDAVVPGGALTLELAEELERLRPFGSGNPQPSLLVPGARVENVAPMGDERQHARFTLVTAGGSRSRGVVFGSGPAALGPATHAPHDIVLRLERNRWKGVEEPRILLRALCDTRPGQVRALGEGEPFWDRVARLLEVEEQRARGRRHGHDRRPPRRRVRRCRGRVAHQRRAGAGGRRGCRAPA